MKSARLFHYHNNLERPRAVSPGEIGSQKGEKAAGRRRASRLREDRSYEIAAAAEQTSFAEFGQDFNRLGAAAYASLARRLKVTTAAVVTREVLSDDGGLSRV